MTKQTITPREAAAILSSAAQEPVSVRKILYWSRVRLAGFPTLATDLSAKFQRFNRSEIEAWAKQHFPDMGEHRAKKSGDA